MKIMYVSNNPKKYRYDQTDKSGWNLLPSLLKKNGVDILGIGKYELHKFYSEYKRFKPDLIIGSWVPASCIPPLFKKLGLVKCPVIFEWGDYYAESMTNYPKPLVRFMENYSLKNSDYVVTISKWLENRAKKQGKKVFYFPNGYFEAKKSTKINLNKLKTKKENFKVIYLGEQSRWKKVDKIIKAANSLNVDLFLFGKTNPDFKRIAKENVHFMDYIDEQEVGSVLKQGDILVNTSNQDSSYKFFEYLSVKKPILAYDGFPALIFEHKKTAFLTKDFKKGLIELINNKNLRENLQKNAKKFKTYTWDEIGSQYVALYSKILNKQV